MGRKGKRSLAGKHNISFRWVEVEASDHCDASAEPKFTEVPADEDDLTDDDVEISGANDARPEMTFIAAKLLWDAFFTAKTSSLPRASEVSQRGQVYMKDSRTTLWRNKTGNTEASQDRAKVVLIILGHEAR